MNGRTAWFLAGTTAGVWTTLRARRVAQRLTPSGVRDQVAAAGVGLQAFADEVRSGMAAREAELSADLGLPERAAVDPGPAHRPASIAATPTPRTTEQRGET